MAKKRKSINIRKNTNNLQNNNGKIQIKKINNDTSIFNKEYIDENGLVKHEPIFIDNRNIYDNPNAINIKSQDLNNVVKSMEYRNLYDNQLRGSEYTLPLNTRENYNESKKSNGLSSALSIAMGAGGVIASILAGGIIENIKSNIEIKNKGENASSFGKWWNGYDDERHGSWLKIIKNSIF
jgi:hypothetical protein